MEFYERIYELRKKHGYTQEEIAKKINVTRQTISNWETGSAQPTIDKAIELADLYDVSIDELIGKSVKNKKEASRVLMSLLNRSVTIYLNFDSEVFFELQNTKIRNCEILEVNPYSIKVIINKKKEKLEKIIFLKDIMAFEKEAG